MDEANITRQQVASANAHSPVGAELLALSRGARKGDAAVAVNKQSDLADIQEEIGNSVSKLADKRSLQRAKVRQGAGVNPEAIKRIADYYERLPDGPRESKLRELVIRLQSFDRMMNDGGSDRRATSSAILQFLQDTGTSPRQQYMLLQGARVHFHANGASEELVSLLNQAENAFKNNKIAYDVRADFAMLVHAKEAASTLGFEPSVLRDKYRELLLSGMNLGQLFYALSDLYKRLNFSSVIDLFLKAAGDDLAATSIETDRALLSNLLRELGVLKTMRSAYESCLGLIERVIRFTPSDSEDESLGKAKNLMGTLLSFCASNTASIEEGRKVFRSVEAKSTTPIARVVFGNGLLEQHRDLPDAVFPSDQARLHQIEILSEICSDLAEDEEHAYESANSLLTNERHTK